MLQTRNTLRIETLVKCAASCEVAADIGCDHGYISYYLLKNKLCKRVILTDISAKNLGKAKSLFERKGFLDFAEFRQGNGLDVLKDNEADFCVIAGMGGIEIINILQNGGKGIKKFLLQPMKNTIELRGFLEKNGYVIEKDFIIFDKKNFYDIIVAACGKDSLNELELNFGRTNIQEKSGDFIKFLNIKKLQTEKILKSLKDEDRIQELNGYLELIDKVKRGV